MLRNLPRFRRAYAALGEFESHEYWSRDQIETYQLDRLNVTWQHAQVHVPHFKQLKQSIELPEVFNSLAEFQEVMPIQKKSDVRNNTMDFFSESPRDGWWTRTGGSTGTPMATYVEDSTHLLGMQAKYRFQQAWGLDIFDRVVFLWGHSGSLAPGLEGVIDRMTTPIHDFLRNRMRLSAYALGEKSLQHYLRRIARFKPRGLYGYASALQLLAREAIKQRIRFDSLEVCMLTGEPATPQAIADIEAAFGVVAVVEYGSYECGFMAHSWRDGTFRVREDLVYIETTERCDDKHDIIVTVLDNYSFPMLRYKIDRRQALDKRVAESIGKLPSCACRLH
ncbi:MAG: hypothetical protein AAF420_14910 [Pseudomonadota bacterium]